MRASVKLVFALAGAAACLSTASADIPAALDRVPTDARVAAAVQHIDHFDGKMKKLLALFKADGQEGEMAMMKALLNTPGLNREGSLAFALMSVPAEKAADKAAPGKDAKEGEEKDGEAHEDEEGEGPVVIIVPVSDAAKFVQAFGGEGKELKKDAVLELDGPADAPEFPGPVYAKDLGGGYIAMGPFKDVVAAFDGAPGRMAAHTKVLGATGKRIADASDILIVSNIQAAAPSIKKRMEDMKSQAAMAMQMAGGGNPAMIELAERAMNSFLRDAQVGIMGVGLDDAGIWFDFGAQFKEKSECATFMQGEGKASKLTARLPDEPFILATSLDFSHPGMKSLFSEAIKAANAADAQSKAGPGIWTNLGKMVDKLDGQAFMLGNSPGLMAGGLFANAMTYIATKEPSAYIDTLKSVATEFNGKSIEGVTYKATYEQGATEIAGTKVDKFSLIGTVDPNSPMAMQMQQVMMMMYGAAGGPEGFVAPIEGGVVQTMSNNTPLMTSALAAAKSGKGLGENESLKPVIAKLPADRTAEVFIGVRSILDMVGPFLPGGAANAPAVIPPIGMGLSTVDGGGQFRIFVPNEVLTTISGMVAELGGGAEDMEEAPAEESGKPPRF